MVVVDASAIAAVAFDDEHATAVAQRLVDEALHAPSLFALEMTNATLNRCRRAPAKADRFVAALSHVLVMPIVLHSVDPLAVFALAAETGLTAYDAAYLWLSRELKVELVSLDRQLLVAARRTE